MMNYASDFQNLELKGMIDTWTCHVCGEERPDEKISVYSKQVRNGGIEFRQNVRYCNDKPECMEGATKVDWLKGPAHYELTKEDGTETTSEESVG
jgi:hypothetical protein